MSLFLFIPDHSALIKVERRSDDDDNDDDRQDGNMTVETEAAQPTRQDDQDDGVQAGPSGWNGSANSRPSDGQAGGEGSGDRVIKRERDEDATSVWQSGGDGETWWRKRRRGDDDSDDGNREKNVKKE